MDHTQKLVALNMARGFVHKPSNWSDVGFTIPSELLEDLPQYTSTELGIHHNVLASFIKKPEETIFLVGHLGGVYIVNTGGYGYCRNIRYVGYAVVKPVPDTLEYVLQAFDNNGMNMRGTESGAMASASGLETATFVGINATGKEMYKVTYTHDDAPDTAVVYVWEEGGKKLADF